MDIRLFIRKGNLVVQVRVPNDRGCECCASGYDADEAELDLGELKEALLEAQTSTERGRW